MELVLDVRNLTIKYRSRMGLGRSVDAVRGVSFSIGEGQMIALVGSTGSGKNSVALALGGLLPPHGRITGGEAIFTPAQSEDGGEGIDLLRASSQELRKFRGGSLGYLFRDISAQLNPRMTIRRHIRESVQTAGRSDEFGDEKSWMPVLYEVGLVEPETLLDRYPDQLANVIVQRLLIAMALMRGARFLIADNPTASLDATGEAQILRLLGELRDSRGLAILLVTHNFGILEGLADRISVMFEGSAVETGTANQVLKKPKHIYTRALLKCVPRVGRVRATRLGEVDHITVRDEISTKVEG